jgi:predicted transcriptional regulator
MIRLSVILLAMTGERVGEDLLRQPMRKQLVNLIKTHPGIHTSELAREVDQPWGTVHYHLRLLRQADLVSTVDAGRERRFFPLGMDDTKARLLSLLHQGRRPDIARYIREHPGSRQVDICDALEVSRKTFRSSVGPLVDEGLVREQRGLNSHRYFPAADLNLALHGMDAGLS